MLLSIGTKVSLKNTKSLGIVTGFLDTGMVRVQLLDSGMEIPVFEEDLVRIAESAKTASAKAKVIQVPKAEPKPMEEPEGEPPVGKTYPLGNTGLSLVFIPDGFQLHDISRYGIYFINDTTQDISFSITCMLKENLHFKRNARLLSCQSFHIGSLDFILLNDNPTFSLDFWQLTEKGSAAKISRELKLKAKFFFKEQQEVPFLQTTGYVFPIWEVSPETNPATPTENLQDYTRKNLVPQKSFRSNRSTGSFKELHRIASFPSEIDLHIEKLVVDSRKIGKKSVLDIQLQHFEEYLDKAIQFGLERVFVIHGLGEGKLRDAIAGRLIQHRGVKTFKNEYHPRYGFGATEVILK